MLVEIIKFLIYSILIVIISKFILVKTLRSLAEELNLKPKVVGNVAGVATSVPELLTIGISSINGLVSAGIVNVISSNVINLIQYLGTIFISKNQNKFKSRAIIIDLIMVIITILIPLLFIIFNIELDLYIVPILLLLYVLFSFIDVNVHKNYLNIENISNKEINNRKTNIKILIKNIIILIIVGILLFYIGEKLGNVLEKLKEIFNISEVLIGIVLGFITSIPELITFFESQNHHNKNKNKMLGVIEATNNLLTSNMMNLFLIQSVGIILFILFN